MVVLAFRIADSSDATIDAVVDLVESAYRGEASRAGWTTEADLLDGRRTDAAAVLEIIEAPASALLLAEEDGDLIGCCQMESRPGEDAYFGLFSVRPRRQAHGFGRAILAEAERIARYEWGADRMSMTVIRQRHDLIAWYERRGYRPTGETRPFPYGEQRFGLPKRPDLEFVVLVKPLR
jgi:GNAT superfamily N-acetyltransferase